MHSSRIRLIVLFTALSVSVLSPQAVLGCEICKYYLLLGFAPCRPVTETEVGSTICTNEYDPLVGFSCAESGTYCSEINAGGGGGSGSGGGGGSQCSTTGFCPAECFSCGGGGGRPAV